MLSYKYNGVIAVVMSYFHSFTFWFHEIFYKFSIFYEIKIFMLVQKGFASAILQWNKLLYKIPNAQLIFISMSFMFVV